MTTTPDTNYTITNEEATKRFKEHIEKEKDKFISNLDNCFNVHNTDNNTRWAKVILIANAASKGDTDDYISKITYASYLLGFDDSFADDVNHMICTCQALKFLGLDDKEIEDSLFSEDRQYEKLVLHTLIRAEQDNININ